MVHVYILQSASTGKFYIGSTSDLGRRLAEHDRRHSPFTRHGGPWRLVYDEPCPTLHGARSRERQLKSWKSHAAIQELIASSRSD